MGSVTPQLPIICFSDKTLKPGSSKWVEVRSDVRKALEDYGGFEASYDSVSKELKESVLEAMKEIFELPVEAKQRNVSPKPYVGYSTHNGLSESLAIQDANVLEKVNEFIQLLRPDCEGNKSFSETIQKFSEKSAELEIMVTRMVMESFGIDKYLDEHHKSTNYRLRLMKYVAPPDLDTNAAAGDDHEAANTNTNGAGDSPSAGDNNADDIANVLAIGNIHIHDHNDDANAGANAAKSDDVGASVNKPNVDHVLGNANAGAGAGDDEKKLGLPPHTDKNLFTILYQHEIEGLEVLTKDEKWIRVNPSHNSFVVMAGDSLYALMNCRVSRPFHRVRVVEKKKTRYSIALFSAPSSDYIIEPPKELVDEKHPRVFNPFTYADLMSFYHTEVGRRAQSTLHAFCAVVS